MKNAIANAVMLLSIWVVASGFVFDYFKSQRLPDAQVYQLSKTTGQYPDELLVRCLNGADATVRPSAVFGEITVSCGVEGQP
jgi:hypothetical protein